MNKNDFIAYIADTAQLTKEAAERALNAVLDGVTLTLKKGDQLALIGFGTFAVKQRAARTGRNPSTGKAIQIAAAKVPHFKAGIKLKEAVNAGQAGGKK